MKKFKAFAVILSTTLFLNGLLGYAAESVYKSSEVELSGFIRGTRTGEKVSICVIKDEGNWNDESFWSDSDNVDVVYMGESDIFDNGSYCFRIILDEQGKYKAYIASENQSYDDNSRSFIRVDKQKNDDAISALIADTEKTLTDHREDLGLFDDIYIGADMHSVSELLNAWLSERKGDDIGTEAVISAIYKAILFSKINSGEITDVEPYKQYLEMGKTEESHYNPNFSKKLTSALKSARITDITKADGALRDSLIVVAVTEIGVVGAVKSALLDFAKYYDEIDESKVTADMCTELIKETGSNGSIDDILSFIEKYKKPGQSGGSSGSGKPGGLTSGGTGSSMSDSKWETEPADVTEVEIFDDLADVTWAKEAIIGLYNKGVINGKTESMFCPNDFITRGEFAKILMKSFKISLVGDGMSFDDVTKDDWCYEYVNSMYLAGITNGIGNNLFGKGLDITRQDLCVMVYRTLKRAGCELTENSADLTFVDEEQIADYAKEAVKKLVRCGVISGDLNGSFYPQNPATRAEAAKIIYMISGK